LSRHFQGVRRVEFFRMVLLANRPSLIGRIGVCALSFLIFLLLGWNVAADDLPAKSALETDSSGWEDIMPPKDLQGWTRVPIPASGKFIRDQWHLEGGQLVCDGDGGHDMLLFDRELHDCIFHVEFCFKKIGDKKGYNSGVFIRTTRDGKIWHQAQVGSASGGYLFGVTPVGAETRKFNVGLKPCRVKEAGEWNTYEVTARGSQLTLWVNGFITADLPDCGLDKGCVGLEGEGFLIQFRNLKLKELH
jgi:3-keto-disaccharide hydrolase